MNHTRIHHFLPRYARTSGIALAVLAAMSAWFGGCADPRIQPLQPSAPGYTETIVLWENAPSEGDTISATFNVQHELVSTIENPADAPARLTIVGYIRPDAEILWREAIIADSIPPLKDQMINLLIILDRREKALKKLITLDSTCTALPDTCDSLHLDTGVGDSLIAWIQGRGDTLQNAYDSLVYLHNLCTANPDTCPFLYIDPAVVDSLIGWVQRDTSAYHVPLAELMADTTVMGGRRDSLGWVVDSRYYLTLWLDPDTTATLPQAVYITLDHQVAGQGIYLAATDTTGYKGRRFQLDLDNFMAANPDPDYLGHEREFNWVTCGSNHPCLSPGDHTLRARLTGFQSKITGTLVLVYERTTP